MGACIISQSEITYPVCAYNAAMFFLIINVYQYHFNVQVELSQGADMPRGKNGSTPNDQTATSWQDLQSKLYDIPQNKFGRCRSDYVYRGVNDVKYGLESSLQRIGPLYASVEGHLFRNFLKYAGPQDGITDSLLSQLAVAQHHGLPTRVLDWTTSPRVAAHFATANEDKFNIDGAIWCFDVTKIRSLLPPKLLKILKGEGGGWVFSIEMLANYKTLAQFDKLRTDPPFVLFFEPPSLDTRIINQGAMLSIMPGPTLSPDMLLDDPTWQGTYKRIIIPKEIKWEVRDKLDQDNVSERMLFPGLDGTSRWLKRYYGAGPTGAK